MTFLEVCMRVSASVSEGLCVCVSVNVYLNVLLCLWQGCVSVCLCVSVVISQVSHESA